MPFRWESPPFDVAADFRAPNHVPALELREFATLEEYSAATGQDRNSVQVGYDVFVDVPALDARDVGTLQVVHDADNLDFRLRRGSAAVDRGMVLPTVTDGFTGTAPDLGRWRSGAPRRTMGLARSSVLPTARAAIPNGPPTRRAA